MCQNDNLKVISTWNFNNKQNTCGFYHPYEIMKKHKYHIYDFYQEITLIINNVSHIVIGISKY